jgi:hypothetical protein
MIPTGHFELRPVKLGSHGPRAMQEAIPQDSGQAGGLAAIGVTSRSERRSIPT